MNPPSYDAARWPVRTEIGEAHRGSWARLASPGTWWTGAERVAIASESRAARACGFCRERKQALSPAAVPGKHDSVSGERLPDAIIDVGHRVASDPGRLSRRWFDGVLAVGVSDAHYVEAVAVTAGTVSIDTFCRGIGVLPHPLPEPLPGEPSRRRPASARGGEAWVPMIAPEDASGAEAGLFAGQRRVPNISRALSLVPDEVRGLREMGPAHYLPFERIPDPTWTPAGRALSRAQMELVAARVSALNQCFY